MAGVHTGEDDFVQEFIATTNHQFLLLFTNKGRMHQLRVHRVPEGSRTARGHARCQSGSAGEGRIRQHGVDGEEFSETRYFTLCHAAGHDWRSNAALYARSAKRACWPWACVKTTN